MQQDSAEAVDRAAFERTIERLREQGAQRMVTSGVVIDDILVKIVMGRQRDERYGISLLAHPTPAVVAVIQDIQEQLRMLEPDQYYYPSSDLHLTFVELLTGRTEQEIKAVLPSLTDNFDALLRDLPEILVDTPKLVFDQQACALNFLPCTQALQQARQRVIERLQALNIPVAPRYTPQSAHLTCMRYLAPLRTPMDEWVGRLRSITMPTNLQWRITDISACFGRTWYGMTGTTNTIHTSLRDITDY